MTVIRRTLFAYVATAALGACTSAQLASTDWPKHLHDLSNTSMSGGVAPAAPVVRWSVSFPVYYIQAPPTIVGTSVVVPMSEGVSSGRGLTLSLAAANGSAAWGFSDLSTGLGNKGTAAISTSGRVYFGSDDGNLYAVDPSGVMAWATPIGSGPSTNSPVVLPNGQILVTHIATFSSVGAITLVNSDGSVAWSRGLRKYPSLCPAVSADGQIVVSSADAWGGAGEVLAYDLQGNLLWSFAGAPSLTSSPVILPSGAILQSFQDGRVRCISSIGTLQWASPVLGPSNVGILGPSLLPDGRIAVGTGNGSLSVLSADGTSVDWSASVGVPFSGNSAPCVDRAGRILYGTDQGVFCFSADGTMEWHLATATPVSGGPVLADDGTAYFSTWGGVVTCLEAECPANLTYAPVFNPENGHWYQRVDASGIDWFSARQQAEAMTYAGFQGHLVSVTSAGEQAFLDENLFTFSTCIDGHWIGAYQDRSAADYAEPALGWRWTTGEAWSYTNWGSGEPNNVGENEDWALIRQPLSDTWNDLFSNGLNSGNMGNGFIVEFERINHPPLAEAGPPTEVHCSSNQGAVVTLNGSGSSDPDSDQLTYTWTGPFGTATGANPTVSLPFGTSTIVLTVSDGEHESMDATSVTVTVEVAGLLSPMAALVPVDSPTTPKPDKAMKQGRTIPLKLRLMCGTTALTDSDVSAPEIVALFRNGEAQSLSVIDPDPGEANDNGPFFRFSDDKWVYNLKTTWATAGSYEIHIRMPDGKVYKSGFEIK